ncbi:sugar transporter SWEET1 isoform X1 [Mobula birostris]|uniref:sugar transporter SWEET1 isoform X1 n=2 Tax=Mobula birostris TaxID=1983395 RepID=UPI003B27CBE1
MEAALVLSWACLVFTIWMFSTGLSDLRRMVSLRNIDNIQFLPYITTAVNNLGWFYYGELKSDWTLMTVNSIGFTLQSCYIMTYLYFSSEKRRLLARVGLAALALASFYLYLSTVVQVPDVRLSQLGLVCCTFTIGMYLSPLADLAKIIHTRSTKCLSFWLTVATFLTSTSWTLYGFHLSDFYIVIPNAPGIVTSLIRFWLFWNYPASPDKYPFRPMQA